MAENKDRKDKTTDSSDEDVKKANATNEEIGRKDDDVTSNAPSKDRKPAEYIKIDADQDKRATPSTSGPKGTEEPGSDKGPGGTGW